MQNKYRAYQKDKEGRIRPARYPATTMNPPSNVPSFYIGDEVELWHGIDLLPDQQTNRVAIHGEIIKYEQALASTVAQ
jgi:hypothetical protein